MITGDTDRLPHIAQFCNVILHENEVGLWSKEDLKAAFYIFKLPEAWWKWFTFSKQVRGSVVGRPEAFVYLCCRVIPMGWVSAVGVMQHIHRVLLLASAPRGAGLGRLS